MSEQYTLTLTKDELALIQQLVSAEYRTVVSYGQAQCVPETMREFRNNLTDKFGSILHKLGNIEPVKDERKPQEQFTKLEQNQAMNLCECGCFIYSHTYDIGNGSLSSYCNSCRKCGGYREKISHVPNLESLRGQGGFVLFNSLTNSYTKPTPCKVCGHDFGQHKMTNMPSEQYCFVESCACDTYKLDEEKAESATPVRERTVKDVVDDLSKYKTNNVLTPQIKLCECGCSYYNHTMEGCGVCDDCTDYREKIQPLYSVKPTPITKVQVETSLCVCGHNIEAHGTRADGVLGECGVSWCHCNIPMITAQNEVGK